MYKSVETGLALSEQSRTAEGRNFYDENGALGL